MELYLGRFFLTGKLNLNETFAEMETVIGPFGNRFATELQSSYDSLFRINARPKVNVDSHSDFAAKLKNTKRIITVSKPAALSR